MAFFPPFIHSWGVTDKCRGGYAGCGGGGRRGSCGAGANKKIPTGKTCRDSFSFVISAEREGFEPPEPLSSSVFKTGAFDHSATFPGAKV